MKKRPDYGLNIGNLRSDFQLKALKDPAWQSARSTSGNRGRRANGGEHQARVTRRRARGFILNLYMSSDDQLWLCRFPAATEVALLLFLVRLLSARNLLLGAAGSAALYFIALHPWTGAIGGVLFWIVGSWLPTAFIVLLSLGLAFLLPVSLRVRLPVALVLSFLFGINTALPELPGLLGYRNDASWQVLAKVPPVEHPRDAIRIKRRPWPPLFAHPLAPQLRVGGDEGCMCMYFRETTIYSDEVQATQLRVSGRRATMADYARSSDPTQEQRDVHLDVMFWQNEKGYSTRIELVDHGKPVARFDQHGIPLSAVVERKGLGREKLAENFWENAAHLFARDNAWSIIVDRIASYYPERQVEDFLREAGAGP
jgi:hypothetical protein